MSTKISWTDEAWNCIRGCDQVSPGCANCYAKHMAARIVRMGRGKPTPYDGLVRLTARGEPAWTGEVAFDHEKLAAPLRWKKPRRIFVNSMSDLFHEKLTNEQIAAVFGVMAACPQHMFQCLTKRAKRMREWFAWSNPLGKAILARIESGRYPDPPRKMIENAAISELNYVVETFPARGLDNAWPLPNVWIGVSVERQDEDHRVVDLLQTPAAVRFLSCEPLLGPVDVSSYLTRTQCPECGLGARVDDDGCCMTCGEDSVHYGVDWLIAGCESGPGARSCDVEWLRSLRDQCSAAGVPFFLKQAVEPSPHDQPADMLAGIRHFPKTPASLDGSRRKPGSVIELPYLDGKQHTEFPR